MPQEVKTFVGREEALDESTKRLEGDENFLIITGGPCYGKSSLAVQIGYAMYEKWYNYVVWINMRDLTRNAKNPSIEDVALEILKQFDIDTSEMKDDIVSCLKTKFGTFEKNGKAALLIFDNADFLIQPAIDKSCRTSAYTQLCELIRSSRNSVRAIFTTRVCKTEKDEQDHQIKIGYLSDDDSRKFLNEELNKKLEIDRDMLIDDIVKISHGLPYALRLICSEVNLMESKGMVQDYVKDLKEKPLETLDDDSRLTSLFDLSYERLNQAEKELFTFLAVFPSGFSYDYLSKVVRHLEKNKLKPRLLHQLTKHSLVNFDSNIYMIHPYVREYLMKFWNDDSKQINEKAFHKTYCDQIFNVAKESLNKDSYSDRLKEFEIERQNFTFAMTKVCESTSDTSYLGDVFKEVLERPTPDYIAALLFYINEISFPVLMQFFSGCEIFVVVSMKKNIWCCRYDGYMKHHEEKIDDPYKDWQPDEYGRALMDKRSSSMHCYASRLNKDLTISNFNRVMSSLDDYMQRVDELNDTKMKAYFTHKILKVRANLSKKVFKQLNLKKEDLIKDLTRSLEICKDSFGAHWLTIDCCNQLGKLYWYFKEHNETLGMFDMAIDLTKGLFETDNREFRTCFFEKGRFLANSDDAEDKKEGKKLIEDAIKRCEVAGDVEFSFFMMGEMVKFDRAILTNMRDCFCNMQQISHRSLKALHTAVTSALNSPDPNFNEESFLAEEISMVDALDGMINHLEDIKNSLDQESTLFQDVTTYVYVLCMWMATKCMHVLPMDKAKEFARKALTTLESYKFIKREKQKQLLLIENYDQTQYRIEGEICRQRQIATRSKRT